MTNTVLEKLWTLAQAEAELIANDTKTKHVFGELGLYLEIPPKNWGYYPTPVNSSTFAQTMGDSVHYGLLHIDGEIAENSPVIMTVPCNSDEPNFIVGENLMEFLCLGCEIGYFGLEQLAYDWDDTVYRLSRPEHPDRYDCIEGREELLSRMVRVFSLKPWQNVNERLVELKARYLYLLELPPDW